MRSEEEIDKSKLIAEMEVQKQIAFKSGLLQGDITIRTLLESIAEGVVIIDSDSRIILINSRLEKMLGFSQNEVMGKYLSVLIPVPYFKSHQNHVQNFFKEPRIRPMGHGIDLTARCKDNTEIPVEISLSYLNTNSGVLGLAFVTNITSRKKAEDELKQQNKELDAFAQMVAHDLGSSVSGLIGLSDILSQPGHEIPEETRKKYMEVISENGKKMSEIIKELLTFARLKREDVKIERVDNNKLFKSVFKRLDDLIEKRNVEIIISNKLHDCMGYGSWIEEIWYNFVSNAIKYGGIPPKIEIGSVEMNNGYTKYWIKDNGEGLSEDEVKLLFNEDFRQRAKIVKGHGFGLHIVKSIVRKLDGKFEVNCKKGEGCTFSIMFKSSS